VCVATVWSVSVTALTSEQRAVLDASRQGVRRLKVEALAGTGKTTTLVELAKDLKVRKSRQRTLYVAFNRFVVDDVALKVSRFADAMTVNSLALRMVGREYQAKLSEGPKRMSLHQAADLLGIDGSLKYTVRIPVSGDLTKDHTITLNREKAASLVSSAVLRFCRSLDREIDESHFDSHVSLGPRTGRVPVPSYINRLLVDFARVYWADLCDVNSRRFRFRHEHYMKMWHLSDPVIPYDTVLFDEAQDADPLMRDVVERHQGEVVWCGDRFQAIYGWRGAVNAMQEVEADQTLYLTKSFRFSSSVAEVANSFLSPLGGRSIEGAAAHESVVLTSTTPDVEIFRTNQALIEHFMTLARSGASVRTDADLAEIERLVNGLIALRNGKRPAHSDLAEFGTLFELQHWLYDPMVEDDEFRVSLRKVLRHDLDDLMEALAMARESHDSTEGRLLTTAHKSKGLGFDRVIVHDDFPVFSPTDPRVHSTDLRWAETSENLASGWQGGSFVEVSREHAPELFVGCQSPENLRLWWRCPSKEEWQLAYVAVTRAQRELVHPFTHIDQVVGKKTLSDAQEIVVDDRDADLFDVTAEVKLPVARGGLSLSEKPDVTVAGSSFYQENIARVVEGIKKQDDRWAVTAAVTREPDNKFDLNAVVVTVEGHTVGYIPKELAATVGTSLGDATFVVPGFVVGGYLHNGKRALFGVRLCLAWGR